MNVFEEEIASAPAANAASASFAMFVVVGVSLTQTGTRAAAFTTRTTVSISSQFLPMFEPMSSRSMCGHDRFSSNASTPWAWHASASSRQ